MPGRTRTNADETPETSDETPKATGSKRKFVVLTDGVVIEHRRHKTDELKAGTVARATVGQIITLDMDLVNEDKIQRLIELKALAPYEKDGEYKRTTAKAAVDAAGARPDPVAASLVEEDQPTAPQESELQDSGPGEDETPSE